MDVLPRAARWRGVDVAPDAWRQPHIAWDPRDLIDLSVLGATSSPVSLFTPEVLGRIVTCGRLRSWEALRVGVDGGLHRERGESADAGLLAWTIAHLWDGAGPDASMRDGAPRVEVRDSGTETDALACLPLGDGQSVSYVIAVWITAHDLEAAEECVSRLTLVRHLWTAGARSDAHLASMDGLVFDVLTARQLSILSFMAQGLTNGQIAQGINFSESTVRLESMSIYRHFGVHSRVDAVRAARASGEL